MDITIRDQKIVPCKMVHRNIAPQQVPPRVINIIIIIIIIIIISFILIRKRFFLKSYLQK